MAHDYDPSWDYEIDKRPPQPVVEAVRKWLRSDKMFYEALGLSRPRIAFVTLPGSDHLARYINGTSSEPVFVVDARRIARDAKRYRVDLYTAVQTTLLHELGHAYLDSCGVEVEDEEEIVERFARGAWRGSPSALDFLKDLCR